MSIRISYEGKRGCGYRKEKGLYLVSGKPGRPCGKLPIPLDVCPTCGGGIKPARGWTWVDGDALVGDRTCSTSDQCIGCGMDGELGRVGLIWVGGKYYQNPEIFIREAFQMGISRRITAVPRGFKIGETCVLLAHREAIPPASFGADPTPGIFGFFQPEAIEYIVSGEETPDELSKLENRGITLVEVRHIEDVPQDKQAMLM
jgi:hypothetical protein